MIQHSSPGEKAKVNACAQLCRDLPGHRKVNKSENDRINLCFSHSWLCDKSGTTWHRISGFSDHSLRIGSTFGERKESRCLQGLVDADGEEEVAQNAKKIVSSIPGR